MTKESSTTKVVEKVTVKDGQVNKSKKVDVDGETVEDSHSKQPAKR